MIGKNHAPFVSELGFYRLPDIPGPCDERKGIAVGLVNQYPTIIQTLRVSYAAGSISTSTLALFPQGNS
jgi:hypothetical protein